MPTAWICLKLEVQSTLSGELQLDDVVKKALSGCYDAVMNHQSWPDALHALSRSVNAACIMFYPFNADLTTLETVPISHDYREFIDFYIQHKWYEGHYRAERGWPHLKHGKTIIEHDIASDEERQTLVHYNELYIPFEFIGFAAVGFRAGDRLWAASTLRYEQQGHFTREDATALSEFGPHFSKLVSLSEKLTTIQAAASLATLDRISCAALLLDWRGLVFQMNTKAESLIGHGLRLKNGAISADDDASNHKLQSLVRAICSRDINLIEFNAPPIHIYRSDRRSLVVEYAPIGALYADVFNHSRAMLLVTDLDERPVASAQRLRALFGLTPAEARLAERLAAGEELKAIAESFGITFATVRKQLDSVFAKTNTNRQGQLVALLNQLPKIP